MKHLLLALFILTSLQADARHKKAPPTEFSEEPANEPYKELAKAGLRSYRQVEFKSDYGETLDTSRLYIFRFDEQGLLLESNDFEYTIGKEQEKPEPPFDKIKSRVREASRTSYQYDAAGNVISMKIYGIILAGSGDALMLAFTKKYSDNNIYDTKEQGEKAEANRQADVKQFIDSFQKANTQDELFLKQEYRYTYGPDGNILTQAEPQEHKYTRYTYAYDKAGFVTVRRGVYRFTGDGGNSPYYSGHEVHYTYTPDGRPASVRIYSAERDTGNIAQDKYLVHQHSTHYNQNGDADTMLYLRRGATVKHIIAYEGHLRTAYTILGEKSPKGKNDTMSFATYRYKDTNVAETITWFYADGKRANRTREITDYNSRNLAVEHTRYNEDGTAYSPSDEVKQSLFFYGNATEDNETALRRRREEAVVSARRQQRAGKEREEWARSQAAQKQQAPDMSTDPGLKQATPVSAPQDPEDPILRFIEQMPRFDGDLYAFITANLHYPEAAKRDSIEGRVAVQLVVRRDGSVTDVTVVRSAGHGLDEEAVKMVQRMPKWIPGKQQGRAMSVYFTLPVTFKLKRSTDAAADGSAGNSIKNEALAAAPDMKHTPLQPAIVQKARVVYYDNKVNAISGKWSFSDVRGEENLKAIVEKKSRIIYDVYPDPSEYFYTGVQSYILYEGAINTWYPNGNRESTATYHHGIQDGHYDRWYYYGNKEVTGAFRNGIAVGNWIFYYPNGRIMMTATYDTVSVSKISRPNAQQNGNYKPDRTQIMNWAVSSIFRNPLNWLGRNNNPVGMVHLFDEHGDSASILSFSNGRRNGSWQFWVHEGKKLEVIYRNDTITAFYDRHGHNLATDDKFSNTADFERAFYANDSIDSSGPEPLFPANYAARDTNFKRTSFPGGDGALQMFISRNLRFPQENLQVKKEGNVAVAFIVQSDGTLSRIRITNGLGYGCDEEALRLVKAMPPWIPAKENGRNVAMHNTVVIPFMLR